MKIAPQAFLTVPDILHPFELLSEENVRKLSETETMQAYHSCVYMTAYIIGHNESLPDLLSICDIQNKKEQKNKLQQFIKTNEDIVKQFEVGQSPMPEQKEAQIRNKTYIQSKADMYGAVRDILKMPQNDRNRALHHFTLERMLFADACNQYDDIKSYIRFMQKGII